MTFTLTIRLGSFFMRTGPQLASALRKVAVVVERLGGYVEDGNANGQILAETWRVSPAL